MKAGGNQSDSQNASQDMNRATGGDGGESDPRKGGDKKNLYPAGKPLAPHEQKLASEHAPKDSH
eukprot:6383720-Amphidinium_carterae.1